MSSRPERTTEQDPVSKHHRGAKESSVQSHKHLFVLPSPSLFFSYLCVCVCACVYMHMHVCVHAGVGLKAPPMLSKCFITKLQPHLTDTLLLDSKNKEL